MSADETPAPETEEQVETAPDAEDAEEPTAATADTGAGPTTPGRLKRVGAQVKRRSSGKVLPAVLALLVVASLGLLGGLYYFSYLPDRETDGAAAKAAITAASEGTVAVLSYSPDTLDRDFSSAKSHLTGDFLTYYNQFTREIVAPAAKQKSVKTNAVVLRAAISEFRPGAATVLLFVNQSTQSKDRPEPTLTSSSVLVKLDKADGKWLISSFNPV
ncbi:twin-arginine translocation pathway signal [Mycobacterium servetii]|uniref:Twin-arginine translocation pathway signal n=1 Tax=Mycobacterium servetii TaxID=3237418 RepID=A0ABV4BX76_9MYCO